MNRALVSFAFLLASACAGPAPAPRIEIRDAWARATAPGQASGAAYLNIANDGATADSLIVVHSTRSATATIHDSRVEGGVMRMRMLSTLDLPAKARVQLTPGGTHIMLSPLTAPLRAGETFQLSLRFEKAGEIKVPVTVVAVGAR